MVEQEEREVLMVDSVEAVEVRASLLAPAAAAIPAAAVGLIPRVGVQQVLWAAAAAHTMLVPIKPISEGCNRDMAKLLSRIITVA